jgi:hypothetical protein
MQPVSPNKKLVAAAGCILAMMNAVAFAMWRNRKSITTYIPNQAGQQPVRHLTHTSGHLASSTTATISEQSSPQANDEEQSASPESEPELWAVETQRTVSPR